jgi:hypothetical protein
MNALKWISLVMLVLGLCSVPVQAQLCGIGISINDYFADSPGTPAAQVHVGMRTSHGDALSNFLTNGEPYLHY